MPNNETELPKRAKALTDKLLPSCKKSRMDAADPRRERPWILALDPMRTKLRTDNELPRLTRSMTDAVKMEPTRANPWILAPDPTRAKLRTDNELPRFTQSMMDAV
jgi:type VI protein secretion system component VasA